MKDALEAYVDPTPHYYTITGDTEAIDVIRFVLTGPDAVEMSPIQHFHMGSLLAYLIRCTRKGDFHGDLYKAHYYLEKLIGERDRPVPMKGR